MRVWTQGWAGSIACQQDLRRCTVAFDAGTVYCIAGGALLSVNDGCGVLFVRKGYSVRRPVFCVHARCKQEDMCSVVGGWGETEREREKGRGGERGYYDLRTPWPTIAILMCFDPFSYALIPICLGSPLL